MRYLIPFVLLAIFMGLINACGPSEEELERRRQARQDSIEQARQDSIEQARKDSIRQARQDSIEARKRRKERNRIEFDPEGEYTVQVESWRSKEKAQAQVGKWKDRGYENAYVVKYGTPETGNIWFRVRLGRVATLKMAKKLGAKLQRNHNAEYWITHITDEGEVPKASD